MPIRFMECNSLRVVARQCRTVLAHKEHAIWTSLRYIGSIHADGLGNRLSTALAVRKTERNCAI